jgi:regulator of cell morphogenesis and NO signaling
MTPELRPDRTVGDIVAHNGRTASVFSRHGIDFCCGGGQTLEKACASKHLDVAAILHEIADLTSTAGPDEDVTGWSATKLVEWIVTRHHAYVRTETPMIAGLLEKAVARHGAAHPELAEMRARFSVVADDLTRHMAKEERILFPAIVWLEANLGLTSGSSQFPIAHPIAAMRADHEEAALQLEQIRQLANGYVPPPDACRTWKAAYAQLEAFEADLHRHVHLENEVLFPLAQRLVATGAPPEPVGLSTEADSHA